MTRYLQVKIVMACVELYISNENIMEPVDWRFSYRFCSSPLESDALLLGE